MRLDETLTWRWAEYEYGLRAEGEIIAMATERQARLFASKIPGTTAVRRNIRTRGKAWEPL